MAAIPKQKAYRDRHLLDMAKNRSCLLQIPSECNHMPETTVACHANWVETGKGMGMKAPDMLTVWGCSDCHSWLDQGASATRGERWFAWWSAYRKQLKMWAFIANGSNFPIKERASAAKAILEFLEWRNAHLHVFDEGDWQLEFAACVDCLEFILDKTWSGYTNNCPECEKRMKSEGAFIAGGNDGA